MMKSHNEAHRQSKTSRTYIIVLGTLLFLGVCIPGTLFAATAHLEENAPQFINKTQDMYGAMVASAALLHDVDPKLILAVIIVESEGNPNVVSYRGAQGLMQLMPGTARAMGVKNAKEPRQNILAGTKYLKLLENTYGFDSFAEMLVAYNMGPSGAKRWLARNAPEDYHYVKNVMYIYGVLDEKEKEDARLAQNSVKRFVGQDIFSGLQPLVNRPRVLSMLDLPMTMLTVRDDEIKLEN
ncbi:MAG: hypothetical protein A2942_04345 [Candidatus Lloydbacteria bacterium RIFCSPLOWO2_01_FULL_50_20]|uniref:Transglycosylase SLT domain-containing protein n=1 Tax=Candidatus Lloydbacteria bacterium RIFCSPLOWO2_01_FULL_50_20 TaxID=1798665 RepID=A0A1G2DCT2_9BACT|nr:MAG: hypothetical protein A2942_04345 [Candidatus Lloydbacteria bacterium RIFCSPLOWO2_01_FULL_50_20]